MSTLNPASFLGIAMGYAARLSNGKIEGNFMHIHRDLCMKKNIRIVFQYRIMIDIYHNLAGRSEDAL